MVNTIFKEENSDLGFQKEFALYFLLYIVINCTIPETNVIAQRLLHFESQQIFSPKFFTNQAVLLSHSRV